MMTLYEYLKEYYGNLKPKNYRIRAVQRILALAEKYPQLKRMPDFGLYQLRWGELQALELPEDFPVEPHMRSYACEELTQEYRRRKGEKPYSPVSIAAMLRDPDAMKHPLLYDDPF